MKKIIVTVLVLGIIAGGGYWLMHRDLVAPVAPKTDQALTDSGKSDVPDLKMLRGIEPSNGFEAVFFSQPGIIVLEGSQKSYHNDEVIKSFDDGLGLTFSVPSSYELMIGNMASMPELFRYRASTAVPFTKAYLVQTGANSYDELKKRLIESKVTTKIGTEKTIRGMQGFEYCPTKTMQGECSVYFYLEGQFGVALNFNNATFADIEDFLSWK